MYKLKETDKNKNFDALNGEQFNLNFIVQEKSIIGNFLEDGTANLNLTFTTGASAEELEINLLQVNQVFLINIFLNKSIIHCEGREMLVLVGLSP